MIMNISKKLSSFISVGVLCALVSMPVAAEVKVGVLDMRTIVAQSPQAKTAMENLKKEFKAREEQMASSEKSLKVKMDKLQRDTSIMSAAEKTKLEKDVAAGQRDLQRLQNDFREDATARQQEEMKKLVDKINRAVENIAKTEKYDLIIHSEAAPFS